MYKIPDDLDDSLTVYRCSGTQISKIENLPSSLTYFDCCYTQVSKIENLPNSLTCFDCSWAGIKYIDNIPIEQLNFSNDWEFIRQYNILKRIQRRMKLRYKIKNKKARIIQAGCENWLYKPYCNDNTIGIVPRLAMKELELN